MNDIPDAEAFDNQPDADQISILLIDDEVTWAKGQRRKVEQIHSSLSVSIASSVQEAQNELAAWTPDCIVCDYRLENATGLDLLEGVRQRNPDLPFILITGQGDEDVASDAIREGVTDYIQKSDVSTDTAGFVQRLLTAVDHYHTQRALSRERQSKDAMLAILTETTSYERVAREFCRHLVADRGYDCAWIGVDDPSQRVVIQSAAGERSYVDAMLDATAAETDEPSLVAFETGELRVESLSGGGATDDKSWQTLAREHGFQHIGAVPFESDGRKAVLAVYASEDKRIDDHEQSLLAEYGQTIGYAMQVTGWKQSLISATPRTVTYEIRDTDVPLFAFYRELPADSSHTTYTAFFHEDLVRYVIQLQELSKDEIEAVIESLEAVQMVDILEQLEGIQCELTFPTPTPESILAERGAKIVDISYDENCAGIQTIPPDQTDIESLATALRDEYESVSIGSVRSIQSTEQQISPVYAELTPRQQEVLELAYYNGYFSWPRDRSSEELASRIGINRTTFSQHLREAERKAFAQLFGQH